jgi:hypothetical protein
VGWIDLAEDKDQWPAVVKTAVNFFGLNNVRGISSLAGEVIAVEEIFNSS